MTLRLIPQAEVPPDTLVAIAKKCGPFVRARGESDYWLYGNLFSTTCKAVVEDGVAGAFVVAFRNQSNPSEIYIQDVAVAPGMRHRGCATMLVNNVLQTAEDWHVARVWLTSEPENTIATRLWARLGFVNPPTDHKEGDLWVTRNLKGANRDRVIFERQLVLP